MSSDHKDDGDIKQERNDDKYMTLYPTISSLEISPCPSSSGFDKRPLGEHGGSEEERDGGMTFLVRPLLGCEAGTDGIWLGPGREATPWLDLFYGKSTPNLHLLPRVDLNLFLRQWQRG